MQKKAVNAKVNATKSFDKLEVNSGKAKAINRNRSVKSSNVPTWNESVESFSEYLKKYADALVKENKRVNSDKGPSDSTLTMLMVINMDKTRLWTAKSLSKQLKLTTTRVYAILDNLVNEEQIRLVQLRNGRKWFTSLKNENID